VTLTAQAIAEIVGGELRGDPRTTVEAMAPLDRAESRHVSFLASPKYVPLFVSSHAGVVLVSAALDDVHATAVPSRVVVEKPYDAMLAVLPRLYGLDAAPAGIAPTAHVGDGVHLGGGVRIDDYAVIGDGVVIGDQTHIYSHVTVYPGTEIGARCLIHAGARIGSDGFGYVFRNGVHDKIPHVGRCVIGNDVEIGANTTIDRGSIDDTVIGDGTKIDNLVHVGHNVRIGKLCLLMAQVGIAGSAHIGDGVLLAGQAGIGGHVEIGAGARIAGQAGVFGDVPAGETWSGYPARPHRESLRASGALLTLAKLVRQIEQLVQERTEVRAGEEQE
jgi:UDP-3-O-[3-hydroxymyristoyl] glucosamine N-acyltransferase